MKFKKCKYTGANAKIAVHVQNIFANLIKHSALDNYQGSAMCSLNLYNVHCDLTHKLGMLLPAYIEKVLRQHGRVTGIRCTDIEVAHIDGLVQAWYLTFAVNNIGRCESTETIARISDYLSIAIWWNDARDVVDIRVLWTKRR